MADNNNPYIFPLGIDAAEVLKGFDLMEQSATDFERKTLETGAVVQKTFQQNVKEAEKLQTEIIANANALGTNEEAVLALQQQIKRYAEIAAKSFDPKLIGQYIERVASLEKEVEGLKTKLKGMGEEGEKGAKKATAAMQLLAAGIDQAKKNLAGMAAGSKEYKELELNIRASEVALKAMGGGAEEAEGKITGLKQQLKEAKVALAAMKLEGLDNTKAYKELRNTAGELADTIADVSAEVATAGSDTSGLDKLIRVTSLAAGGFNILQGGAAIFGATGEEVQKSLLKVNAAMAVLNGLQAVQEELSRRDSIALAALGAVQKAYTTFVGESTGALKLFKTALIATGIGAFLVALGLLVAYWDDVTKAVGEYIGTAGEAVEIQKALNSINEKAIDKYVDETKQVQLLSKQLENKNLTKEEEKKIIQQLQSLAPAYFGNLKTEGELTDNITAAIQRYLAAKLEQAKAQAAYDLYVEKEKEVLKQQASAAEENVGIFQKFFILTASGYNLTLAAQGNYNEGLKNSAEKTRKLSDEAQRFYDQYVKFSNNPATQAAQSKQASLLEIENKKTTNAILLAQAKEGSAQELRLKKEAIELQRQQDVQGENLTQEQIKLVNAKANQDLIGLNKDYNEKYKALSLERVKAIADSEDKLKEVMKQRQEAQIALMAEGANKEKALLNISFKERIDKIEAEAVAETNRIKNGKNISAQEIKNVAEANKQRKDLVTDLQKQQAKELLDIDKKYIADNIALQLEYEDQRLNLQTESTNRSIELAKNEATRTIEEAKLKYLAYPEVIATITKAANEKLQRDISAITLQGEEDRLAVREDIAKQTAELIVGNGKDEARTTQLKNRLITDIEVQAAKDRLELLTKTYDKEGKIAKDNILAQFSDKNIQAAADKGVDIFSFLGINFEGSPEEIETAKTKLLETIGKIKTGVKLQSQNDKTDLFGDILGISKEKFDTYADATKQAVNGILQVYSDYLQQRIQLKQEEIDILSGKIDEAQSLLDEEEDRAKAGYANNVESKRIEVEDLKKQRDKAIQDQKENQKEEAKLAIASQAIAFASAGADLIAAVAAVTKQYAKIPYVGVALAVAAGAALVGNFIALRNSIKKYQSLGEGGVVGGKRHSQGGNKYVSMDGNDANVTEIEEGEHLTRRSMSVKHADLLEAINKDDFSKIDVNNISLKQLLEDTGVHLPSDIKRNTLADYGKVQGAQILNLTTIQAFTDNDSLLEIAKNTKYLANAEKNREIAIPLEDGRIMIRRGNETIFITPKKTA